MNLKLLREQNNKSQNELAKTLAIGQSTYSKYENGDIEPSIAVLTKLADYYGVTMDYLVGRPFANDAGFLNKPEKELLNLFREVSEAEQYKILGAVTALVKNK